MARYPKALDAGLLAAAVLFAGAAHAQAWRPIFGGRSLTGWIPKIAGHPLGENWRDTFVVKDGAIRVSYAGYDRSTASSGIWSTRPRSRPIACG